MRARVALARNGWLFVIEGKIRASGFPTASQAADAARAWIGESDRAWWRHRAG